MKSKKNREIINEMMQWTVSQFSRYLSTTDIQWHLQVSRARRGGPKTQIITDGDLNCAFVKHSLFKYNHGDQTWKGCWGIFRVVLVTGAVAAAILLAAPWPTDPALVGRVLERSFSSLIVGIWPLIFPVVLGTPASVYDGFMVWYEGAAKS